MIGTSPLTGPFHLARESRFSYECKACRRCCQGKRIPLNPYEVARLAEHVGLSTTDFLARHTETGGAILARRDDETCVFLGEAGCTVHPARPLACRLYPLGRQRTLGGDELFAELQPHPQTEGVYGQAGTVDEFLESQRVARHVAMADRYGQVLGRLMRALSQRQDRGEAQVEAIQALERSPMPEDDSLLDVDAMVARYCAERGRAVPADVDDRTLLHLDALEAFVAGLDAG